MNKCSLDKLQIVVMHITCHGNGHYHLPFIIKYKCYTRKHWFDVYNIEMKQVYKSVHKTFNRHLCKFMHYREYWEVFPMLVFKPFIAITEIWSKLPPKHRWTNSEALMFDKQRHIFDHHNPQIITGCYCVVTGEKSKQAMWIFAIHRLYTSDIFYFYTNSLISPTYIQRGRSLEHGLLRCDPLHHDQNVFLLKCEYFDNWRNPWMCAKMHLNTVWPDFPSVDLCFVCFASE